MPLLFVIFELIKSACNYYYYLCIIITFPTFSNPWPARFATRWAIVSSTCSSPFRCSLTAKVFVYSCAAPDTAIRCCGCKTAMTNRTPHRQKRNGIIARGLARYNIISPPVPPTPGKTPVRGIRFSAVSPSSIDGDVCFYCTRARVSVLNKVPEVQKRARAAYCAAERKSYCAARRRRFG